MSDGDVVKISRLGAQGDGIAEADAGPIFVPEGLPGETWRIGESNTQAARLTSSPQRQAPMCSHFSECGGCVAQHMAPDLYRDWKLTGLTHAFAHRGLQVEPDPLIETRPGQRRRTTFGFQKMGADVVFGHYRPKSNDLIAISECPVLVSDIASALDNLRAIAEVVAVARKPGRMVVTAVNNGLVIAVAAPDCELSATQRAKLTKPALASGAVVLTVNDEPVVETGQPVLTLVDADVVPPGEVFLQAVPQAENEIASLVTRTLDRAKHVADLFCGVGTFTFPIAKRARVVACDGDRAAIACLNDAIKRNTGHKPIEARQRDLFRDPLSARELRAFDGVVINPPRAGAEEQCVRLAKSAVKTVVMVACNPATLARDAKILTDGGFALRRLVPIDQFIYSAHLEAVAVFQREGSFNRRST